MCVCVCISVGYFVCGCVFSLVYVCVLREHTCTCSLSNVRSVCTIIVGPHSLPLSLPRSHLPLTSLFHFSQPMIHRFVLIYVCVCVYICVLCVVFVNVHGV